jgi:hypothetical protein
MQYLVMIQRITRLPKDLKRLINPFRSVKVQEETYSVIPIRRGG